MIRRRPSWYGSPARLTTLVVVAALLTATPVRAADEASAPALPSAETAEAVRLYREGLRYYDVMDYERAVAAFKAAYVLSSAPELLFDIAQAYRRQRDCPLALEFYRRYLRAEADASKRARAQALLDDMERCVAASAAAEGKATASRPAKDGANVAAEARAPRGFAPTAAWVRWTATAVGIAAAASGALLVASVSRDTACRPRCSPDQVSSMKTRAALGDVLVVAGAALTVAGVALTIWAATDHAHAGGPPRSAGVDVRFSF